MPVSIPRASSAHLHRLYDAARHESAAAIVATTCGRRVRSVYVTDVTAVPNWKGNATVTSGTSLYEPLTPLPPSQAQWVSLLCALTRVADRPTFRGVPVRSLPERFGTRPDPTEPARDIAHRISLRSGAPVSAILRHATATMFAILAANLDLRSSITGLLFQGTEGTDRTDVILDLLRDVPQARIDVLLPRDLGA